MLPISHFLWLEIYSGLYDPPRGSEQVRPWGAPPRRTPAQELRRLLRALGPRISPRLKARRPYAG